METLVDNAALTGFFEANRAEGALWSFAVEPGVRHQPTSASARSLLTG
jgi:hypothetical protein